MVRIEKGQRVSILGAGLIGTLLSIFLKKREFEVDIWEKRPDPRINRVDAGRSINLALSHRGWRSLEAVGLKDKIHEDALPMTGRILHRLDGITTFMPYSSTRKAIYSVSRAKLNKVLIEEASAMGVKIHFDREVKYIDFEKREITFNHDKRNFTTLIGADGAFSALRNSLIRSLHFENQGTFISHSYKELHLDPVGNDFALNPDGLHLWSRHDFMLIALPNVDKSFTCTLFLLTKGNLSFESLNTEIKVNAFFKKYFPDILALIPDVTLQFFDHPTSKLFHLKCTPWNYGPTVLMGDAAHAILPFYGQGMNAGFENVMLFDKMLPKAKNWEDLYKSYFNSRKADADAINELAYQNFIEMRDMAANENFLLRKKIDSFLNRKYPALWQPQYELVTFSSTPYLEALRLARKQALILDEIMKIKNIDKRFENMNYRHFLISLEGKLRDC